MNRLAIAFGLVVGCVAEPSDSGSGSSSADTSDTTAGDPSSSPTSDPTGDPTSSPTSDPTGDPTSSPTSDASSDSDTSAGDTTTGGCDTGPATVTEIEGCAEIIGQSFCSEGQMHVPQDSEIEWLSDPPHSGPHYPTWEDWGEADGVVPRGNWVHNLEHGGIILGYRCNDDCLEERAVLQQVVDMRPDLRVLLTPDPLLPGDERFSAISWTWIHRFDEPDLAELLCFVDQHENHAPEDVP